MSTRRSSDSKSPSRPAPPPAGPSKAGSPGISTAISRARPVPPAAPAPPGSPLSRAADRPPPAAPAKAAVGGKSAAGRKAAPRPKQALLSATASAPISEDERRGLIARAAYLRGERRGFEPGGEAEDWLAAEKEIDALLLGGQGSGSQRES